MPRLIAPLAALGVVQVSCGEVSIHLARYSSRVVCTASAQLCCVAALLARMSSSLSRSALARQGLMRVIVWLLSVVLQSTHCAYTGPQCCSAGRRAPHGVGPGQVWGPGLGQLPERSHPSACAGDLPPWPTGMSGTLSCEP